MNKTSYEEIPVTPPPESAGAILKAAREAKGIPVELAAHDLKMRPQQVLSLEQDDYTDLPKASYVRFMLVYYAKYLNIPPSRLEPHLPNKWNFQRKGYQEVCKRLKNNTLDKKQPEEHGFSLPSRVLPSVLTYYLFTILVVLGVYFYFDRYPHREDEKFLTSAPPPVINEPIGITKASAISLNTIHTFDSALLERVPRIAAMNPSPVKLTKRNDTEQKAKLLQSALKMSFTPTTIQQLTPKAVITSPRDKRNTSR